MPSQDEIAFHDDFASNPVLFEDDAIRAVGLSDGKVEFAAGTVYVAVGWGHVTFADLSGWRWRIAGGMYACLCGPALLEANGGALAVHVKAYEGMFMLGGPIEEKGRLRYISGCTDTGLIQPLRCGDPCLNYLHFPAHTHQAAHHHPSHRVGLVYAGRGLCHTDKRIVPLVAGGVFVLPTGTKHWFETNDEALRIVVFHPDSEFGPSHQMLNATLS
jgi:mannose-6-phosphate isomerase-like protein (cupin superfamily)